MGINKWQPTLGHQALDFNDRIEADSIPSAHLIIRCMVWFRGLTYLPALCWHYGFNYGKLYIIYIFFHKQPVNPKYSGGKEK